MRLVVLMTALALATPATAQEGKIPAKSTASSVQNPVGKTKPVPKPSVSAEDDKKLGAAKQAEREAADATKQKAWDAKMKRTMGGICRGC